MLCVEANLNVYHPTEKKELAPTILFDGTYKNLKSGERLRRAFEERVRIAIRCGRGKGMKF